jgi:two-component system NarL family sensor kinase
MPKLLILLVLLFCRGLAQTNRSLDSLLRVLTVAKEDTNHVNLLYAISDLYKTNEPLKAKKFIKTAGELSKSMNFKRGRVRFFKSMMYVHAHLSENDSAILYGNKLYDYAAETKDSLTMGIALINLGERYNLSSDYEQGLQYSLKGLKLLEGKGYGDRIEAVVYGCVQVNYLVLKQYSKSIEFGKKAEQIERNDPEFDSGTTQINLGNAYAELGRYKESEDAYLYALKAVKKNNDKSQEAMIYQGLTDLAQKQNNVKAIKRYAEKGLKLGEELGDSFAAMASKQGLSIYYLYEKNYDMATRYANGALELSEKNHFTESKSTILLTLSNIAFATNDINKGYYYQNESRTLSDNFFTESLAKKDAELRIEYETEKKETQIKLQQAQLKQKNTLNSILIGGTAALLIISLLGFRNYKNKQRIQQQRITELETEKRLTATKAIIKGEEQERTRLAKDLHDGLGGMLSGIKHSLSHMKENLIMTQQNAQAFEHSLNMLDDSISEMRRVAHNMMPESLLRFGLDAALKDFCKQVSVSGALKISYQSIDLKDKPVEQSLSITIYRIVQELLNNSIRHASAKNATVQVASEGNLLTVTVEDDGKGFDTNDLASANGIGWKNISSRLNYHNGKLDIKSSPEKGTSVYIEFTTV